MGTKLLKAIAQLTLILGRVPIAIARRCGRDRINSLNSPPHQSKSQNPESKIDISDRWVVSATEAKQLIEQGATILDARHKVEWAFRHVPGAVHVRWQQFSQPHLPHKGKLIEDTNILTEKLRDLGIWNTKPAIVLGNPRNWGEVGRIVWMLRTLGHKSAAWVDGGYAAIADAGVSIVPGITKADVGDFVVKRSPFWEIQRDELKSLLAVGQIIAIDTRELREYAGATPYGEQRGGHVPGAKHFYFKDLLDERGNLLPRNQLLAKLETLGISGDTPVAAYCTGGVRSAFFVSVLVELGFTTVKNYAGSMWDWSAAPANDYPLEK